MIMAQITDIDLRLLRIFVAVVEAGGFSAAESYLNVSTSTISIHMSNLEKRIGVRLCERGRSGFRLTERGRVVFQETKGIFKKLDDFSGKLASVKKLLAGRLSIGMVDCLATCPDFPMPEAVRRFNQVDNDVQIEISVAPRQTLEHDVAEGLIHAAFGPFIRNISSLHFMSLFSERHELYCGVGHPLFGASRKMVKRVDISTYPAIFRLYHHEFDQNQLGNVREEARVYSMEAMLMLLLSGGYIGYLPTHYASRWIEEGALSCVDDPTLGYDSEHGFITKKTNTESPTLTMFVSIVKEIFAENGMQSA